MTDTTLQPPASAGFFAPEVPRTIRLGGQLGKRFGRIHKMVCNDTAEAVRALCLMMPGFERFLVESKSKGMGFSVYVGKENIDEEGLHMPAGQDEIRIVPRIIGSGRGIGSIILGVVMVAAAFYTGGASLAAWGASSVSLALSGLTMIVGGVAQAMTKTPTGNVEQETVEHKPSYNFNGPVNTAAEGVMPVLYGEMMVGSRTASADMYAEDIQ